MAWAPRHRRRDDPAEEADFPFCSLLERREVIKIHQVHNRHQVRSSFLLLKKDAHMLNRHQVLRIIAALKMNIQNHQARISAIVQYER